MRTSLSLVAVVLLSMPLRADVPPEEAAWYAADMGVSVAEAARRLELQRAVGELDAALLEAERETFAGLTIEHQPSFRVVARFTDPAAAARLAARVDGGPLQGLVETRAARHTVAELEQRHKALREAARDAGVAFDSDIDIRANRLAVYTRDPAEVQARLGHALPPGTAVERVERLAERQALIGGARMSLCTSGFTVRSHADWELGVVTSGHCWDLQAYEGVPLPFKARLIGRYHDVQWHTACGRIAVTNEFDSGLGVRACTATRPRWLQAIGQYVCKNGASTGRSCGTIDSRYYAPAYEYDYSIFYEATFIRVNDKINASGDSGAPWFDGDIAVGIHQGHASDGEAIYMAINYVEDLGVSVLTSNPGACARPPVAGFTYTQRSFTRYDLDASSSYNPDGSIVSYTWDFGDGDVVTTSSPTITHAFGPETYTVTLTVTDNSGATARAWRTIRNCGGPGQLQCPY